jgi:purine-binding chemotaxis protein CheW
MADLVTIRYLLFRLAGLTCATDVNSVVEILPVSTPTRIPGTPPEISGLINVRGTLVTLVDGQRALGVESEDERRSVVMLDAGSRMVGFGVDEVLDLVTVSGDAVAGREALPGVESRFVKGVARHGNDTFLVLDTDALVNWVLPS